MAATYLKAIFANGDNFATWINGTAEEAKKYYLNKYFNVGCGENDNIQKCIDVEILKECDSLPHYDKRL